MVIKYQMVPNDWKVNYFIPLTRAKGWTIIYHWLRLNKPKLNTLFYLFKLKEKKKHNISIFSIVNKRKYGFKNWTGLTNLTAGLSLFWFGLVNWVSQRLDQRTFLFFIFFGPIGSLWIEQFKIFYFFSLSSKRRCFDASGIETMLFYSV